MGKKLHVNTAQITGPELEAIARRAGFGIFPGGRHNKVKAQDGRSITMIPRHGKVKRPLAKKIVEEMNAYGAHITFT
jgi:hypothetical protein